MLAFTLAGIVAMHGLASTDPAGQHQSALDVTMAPGTVEPPAVPAVPARGQRQNAMPAAHAAPVDLPTRLSDGVVFTQGNQHDGHDLMAACLAVLLGLLAAVALALVGSWRGSDWMANATRRWSTAAAARAPPRPLFLSLCVFRN
ncbi:hypothetical protein ACQPZQ_45045 [Pseudonocardia sp. CA-142604]|uniref:hypothetical protein n=1 Tax=Pseudonocardia sp. CA-142604 TaxID=3240024 RepID=UPI003D935481